MTDKKTTGTKKPFQGDEVDFAKPQPRPAPAPVKT